MAFGDDETEEVARFPFFYVGSIIRNDDPEKLGRIKANIPKFKTETKWAIPAGFPGIGPGRGAFSVPPQGSNVIIGFIMGDEQFPFYLCGPFGMADGSTEIPREAASQTPENVHRVHGFESDLFEIYINDETKKLVVRTKDLEEEIELDATDRSISIKARNWIKIEAAGISINGTKLQIAGRSILHTGTPI